MLARKRFRQCSGIARTGIVAGVLIASPFALYLGVILGTLGASMAIRIVGTTLGAPIGIVGAILLVSGTTLALGGIIGGALGWLIERFLRGSQNR
jgi:hypothetical protein